MAKTTEIIVTTKSPHPAQIAFLESKAKRKIIRAGRRGGKTVGVAIMFIEAFVAGRRVLYTAPTSEQTDAFWYEINTALRPLVKTGIYNKIIQRNTLRG